MGGAYLREAEAGLDWGRAELGSRAVRGRVERGW